MRDLSEPKLSQFTPRASEVVLGLQRLSQAFWLMGTRSLWLEKTLLVVGTALLSSLLE
jgi:hypothetical protein